MREAPARQGEWSFTLVEDGVPVAIRAHDYDEIYRRPGLYEQVFYDRLLCASPERARDALLAVFHENGVRIEEHRVLDLGAGNGMVGELLPASRTVGVDISAAARDACLRDRPGAYDAYYVGDLANPRDPVHRDIAAWAPDILTCISALGFDDIPSEAFLNAMAQLPVGGWVVCNLRDELLGADRPGRFNELVRWLVASGTVELHRVERYRHRMSVEGEPLHYYMFVLCKLGDPMPSADVPGLWRNG